MTDADRAAAPAWVARFFDAKALAHGPSGVLDHHRERAAAVERFGGLGRGRVLELGAGAGGSAAATADLGHQVVAVELSPRRAAYARELAEARPRLQVVEADFLTWPGDGLFDAVVLWNGFGVGTDEDQRALLRRIAAWLAPGGVALLDVFCPAGWIADAGVEETEEETGLRERVDYDHLRSRFVDTWWFDGSDAPPLAQSARCYGVADLRLLLDGTGLALDAVELDGRPVDLDAVDGLDAGAGADGTDLAAWAAAWSYRVRLRPR